MESPVKKARFPTPTTSPKMADICKGYLHVSVLRGM